jgi:hypothetical protein
MILSTFLRLKPYRKISMGIFLLSFAAYRWRMKEIRFPIVGDTLVPDAACLGYTPQQAVDWYEAIGEHGRSIYFQIALLDLCIMIPSYVMYFGSQLLDTNPSGSATSNKHALSYLSLATGVFDYIESATHGCAVAGSWRPSIVHLVIASAATQFKCAGLGLLTLAAVVQYLGTMGKKKHSN